MLNMIIITEVQRQILKAIYADEVEGKEKGTTSSMIENRGVNRRAFTENTYEMIEEHLIEESLTEKHGKQNWKYYKTTILGKVLIFSSGKFMRQDKRGKRTTFSLIDISPEHVAVSKETGGLASFDDKLLENADKNWTDSSFFYNYLERLKKFDLYDAQVQERQLAKDLHYDGSVLHEQINWAFMLSFDLIDITKMPQRETIAMWGHQEHITEPEYGISIIIPILPEAHFSLTAYFTVENEDLREIFDFIADVLTFNFLVNLKIITGNFKVASPTTKKLFKDPDLTKFYNDTLNELVGRKDDLADYLEDLRTGEQKNLKL